MRAPVQIRTRVAAIVLGTMLLAVAVTALFGSRVLIAGFETLEREDALADLDRGVAVIDADLEALAFKAVDWAMWDDTYAFLEDPRDDHPWVRSNVVPETFEGLQIELLAVSDRQGRIVFSEAHALDAHHPAFVPDALEAALRPGGPFHVIGRGGERTGVLRIEDGALLVAAREVTDSVDQAEPRGILVMARWIDPALVNIWSLRIGLDLDVTIASPEQTMTPDRTVDVDDGDVVARASYPGVGGRDAALTVEVSQPREIVAAGRFSLAILLLVIIATLGAATLVLTPVLDRYLLGRLRRLTTQTTVVGASGEVGTRVDVDGKDEVTELSRSINSMLASLERAQQEQELRNVELVQALEGKDRFVSMVAHELRTPLTAIKGLALTLMRADDRLDDERREALLERLSARADGMQNLVEELLTMSRLAAGKIDASPEPIDVESLVEHLLDDLSTITAGVETDIQPGVAVIADPDHVTRILINLLDNARRYGAPPILIKASATLDGDVSISVRDHGSGVAPEDAERLFERFEQAQSTSDQGLGLGLSIVRSLADLNQGGIRCENHPDGGAVFVLTLPGIMSEDAVLQAHIRSTSRGS